MIPPLEITGLTKVFDTPSGPFVAVKDVNAIIDQSEFVCILGHSGCGKSTVLSILAGLDEATYGGVVIDGHRSRTTGRSTRSCFSRLPAAWLTARENVSSPPTAVRHAAPSHSDTKSYLISSVSATTPIGCPPTVAGHAAVRLRWRARYRSTTVPTSRQPFSMLDSLTPFELPGHAARRVERHHRTQYVIVTHDMDEAPATSRIGSF